MIWSLHLAGDDPWVHLAQEEALFDALEPDSLGLLLYVNRPCVVMGKHQNPLREVRFAELAQRGWPLLRRFSGGGTVFHDPGNLNYSFLVSRAGLSKADLLTLVCEALAPLGADLELTAQGDVLCGGRKVSGTASQVRRNRWMVHGTLLCRTDLGALHGVLGPTGVLDDWVGVASRPQPVRNLELDVAQAARALIGVFGRSWGEGVLREPLPAADGEKLLRSRAWTWDRTPRFQWTGRTRVGLVRARVEDGKILDLSGAETGDETENLSRMVGMTFFSSDLFELFD